MYVAVQGPTPGISSSRRVHLGAVGAAVQHEVAVGEQAREPPQGRPARARASRASSRLDSASASGAGNACVIEPSGSSSGVPYAATSRAATVRAAATETCWPRTARTALSAPSTAPGTRTPGSAATSGARSRILAEHGGRAGRDPRRGRAASGSGATAAARSARPSSLNAARTWSSRGAQLHDAEAVRQAQRPPVRAVRRLLDARHRAGGEQAQQRRGRRRAGARRAAARGGPARAAWPRRRAAPQLGRRRAEDLPRSCR